MLNLDIQNGVSVYLPSELTLGVTRDFLLTAYGDPDVKSSGFSADTYLWNGETSQQSFYAEVNTVTGQLVRFKLSNIPVQEATSTETDEAEASEDSE